MFELSQKELAEITEVTPRQVRNWEKAGLTVRADGNQKRYPAKLAIAFWHERELAKALEKAGVSDAQKLRMRKLTAETEAKEYDLERLRGTLVPVAFMKAEFEGVCARMRSEIESMAPRYAADVKPEDPGAGELVLDNIAEELLAALAGAFAQARKEADGRAP